MKIAELTFDMSNGKEHICYTRDWERTDWHGWWPLVRREILTKRCGYDISAQWAPWVCGEPKPCPIHNDWVCWCGKRATRGCCHAGGQFVCGNPCCKRHQTCRAHA